MRKTNKNNKHGVVNLNESMLSANNKSRPSVSSRKNSTVSKPRPSVDKTKQRPRVDKTKSSNRVKSVNNIRTPKRQNNFVNRDNNGRILITRRALIYGGVGAAALIGIGSGAKFVGDKVSKGKETDNTLTVPKTNVIVSDNITEDEIEFLTITQDITLPYGTLAWANSSNYITCLVPTNVAKPLATVDIINSKTGNRETVIEESVGQKNGYEIYDARANENGIIWTEVNILQGEWHIFASKLSNGTLTNPVMIDIGRDDWETPSIAIADNYVYWQVLPKVDGSKSKLNSSLKKCSLSSLTDCGSNTTQNYKTNLDIEQNPNTVYVSYGRMSTPVYAYNNGVVITPRLESKNVVHQLTYLDFNDKVADSISLPQNMKPLEAGYGTTGFTFSFDAIYNYGEGISNLGTYTPLKDSKNNYTDSRWLNFSRVPSAAPAFCDNFFVVRSTMAICVVDLKSETYCILGRPNASDDYGDYLASTGNCTRIVTYANIYDQPVAGEDKKYCSLRVWEKA